jgi:hypothetical protein
VEGVEFMRDFFPNKALNGFERKRTSHVSRKTCEETQG